MTLALLDEAVHVRIPGKLNLFLRVGPLGDDGYHEVATAYQAVSLYEDVRAWPASGFTIEVSGAVDVSELPLNDSNLALRAARLLARETGFNGGVHLAIEKRVPIAGGMGGGSADAAGALVACDALWQTGLGKEDLHNLAAQLGADVPFALSGGTAIGTGRGDVLNPALAVGVFHWVLVVADFGLATPSVYHELDLIREKTKALVDPQPAIEPSMLQALRAGDASLLAATLHNDLEQAAVALSPELANVLELGLRSGALAGLVSGSGPTLAFLVAGTTEAVDLQITMAAAGNRALRVHGAVPGARLMA